MLEYLPILSIDPVSMLIAIGNLLILFLIVKKFLFKPVNNILEKRANEVEQIYTEAEDLRTEANTNKNIYEEKLRHVKEETDNMIKSATERAQHRSDEIIEEANKDAEHKKKKAETDIALAKKKAVDGMKEDITEMVIGLASQVVEKELNTDIHKHLIDAAIGELGESI